MLYIPEGFAHGFQTLEDNTEIDYEIFPAHVPEAARGIRWDDTDLGICWPIVEMTLSDRDRNLPSLRTASELATLPELPA